MPREIWEQDEVEQHARSVVAGLRNGAWAEAVADDVVYDVANLPDRSSPDDWPEAMLVTAKELKRIVLESIRAERS